MVKILYVEKDSQIDSHVKLANNLGIQNKHIRLVENSNELIGLVKYEKPDLLIIDNSLKNLNKPEIKQLLSRIGKPTMVFVERTNGIKKIKKLIRTKDSYREIPISTSEFLGEVKHLKLETSSHI